MEPSVPSVTGEIDHELGIVFFHHKADQVTLQNCYSFKQGSIPLELVSSGPSIDDGISIHQDPVFAEWWLSKATGDFAGKSHDFLLAWWYQRRKHKCKRWLVVEWDSFCNTDILKWMQPVWDCDISCAHKMFLNTNPDWYWFSVGKSVLLEPFRSKMAGALPFGCLTFSDQALAKVVGMLPAYTLGKINTELRIGSSAAVLGLNVEVNKAASLTVGWEEIDPVAITGEGVWHPIKKLVVDESCQ